MLPFYDIVPPGDMSSIEDVSILSFVEGSEMAISTRWGFNGSLYGLEES